MRIVTAVVLAGVTAIVAACAAPLHDSFTRQGLIAGTRLTAAECRPAAEALWIVVDGTGDCIRYFIAGPRTANPIAIVFFHGDHLAQVWGDAEFRVLRDVRVLGYANATPASAWNVAQRMASNSGVAAVFLSRPGTHGSSGDHKERRRPREVNLVAAALDRLKERHRIGEFVLAGQSGGGHLVGTMLPRRTDVACAVITSGAVAVQQRIRLRGWPADATGATDYVDPIAEVPRIGRRDGLRVFVIGDPADTNVPFSTQRAYYEMLRRHGVDAHLVAAKGSGPDNHGLARTGQTVAEWCARKLGTDEIVKRAAGLSG